MYISDTQIFYTIHKLIQIRLRAKELREICACQAKHRISRKNMSINWVNKSHRAKSSLSIDIAFERITHKTNELKTYKYTHSHHLYNTRLERQLSTHTQKQTLYKNSISFSVMCLTWKCFQRFLRSRKKEKHIGCNDQAKKWDKTFAAVVFCWLVILSCLWKLISCGQLLAS